MINTLQAGWKNFIELCVAENATEALSEMLDVLLTTEEKSDIAARCLIIKALLAANKTQREIAKELQVSIAKVTRGSNVLKKQDAQVMQRLKKYLS